MINAFVEISHDGTNVEVHFRYDPDLVRCIKQVPGARYRGPDKGGPYWIVPLALDTLRRLREEIGKDRLVYGQAMRIWIREATDRERNLHSMAASDDYPLEKLQIYTKLPELAAWLRPYQRADVAFLASTSAANLNQQRLGKTPELVATVYESDLEDGPQLIVAPRTSLETVWRFEIERWTGKCEKPPEVITFSGALSASERQYALDEFKACVADGWPVWFVCTPDTVRESKQPDVEWNVFAVDEFHKTGLTRAVGNRDPKKNSKFALVCKDIKAQRRYPMSGTPMGGKVIKLWGALHFMYPQQFTSKWNWAQHWLQVSNNGFGNDIGDLMPGREAEFYKALAPYLVRRLRKEVLPQLPEAQWIDVWCDMSPKQKKQYDAFADKAELEIEEKNLNALGILAQYARLKIFASAYCDVIEEKMVRCSRCEGSGEEPGTERPDEAYEITKCTKCGGTGKTLHQHLVPSEDSGKLTALLERLEEQGISTKTEDEEGESLAIISSQFKEIADMIHRYLNEKGIKAVKITGDTKDKDRAEYQMLFRQDGKRRPGDPRVIVMTTTAGGVAITLDMVENVHIMDETWVPDDQEQLADRAVNTSRQHQIGVYVYRSNETIEEDIAKTNIDKAKINREILDLRRQGFRASVRAKNAVAAAKEAE